MTERTCIQCSEPIRGRVCFTWTRRLAYLCGACADASTHAIDVTCGFAYHGRTLWFASAYAAAGAWSAVARKYRHRKVSPVRARTPE